MKSLFRKIFDNLWPENRLIGEYYEQLWVEKKRKRIFHIQLFILPILAIIQILHYFLIDIKISADPYQFWFFYRMKVFAAFSAASLLLIPRVFDKLIFPRFPIFASGIVLIYYQTDSINATDYPVPPYWSFIFITAWVFLLGMNPLFSVITYLATVSAVIVIFPALTAHMAFPHTMSIIVISVALLAISRMQHISDLAQFIAEQEKEASQIKEAEVSRSALKTARKFTGRVLADRIHDYMKIHRHNYEFALASIVGTQESKVALIWTDFRNYTEASKDINFLADKIIPNIKQITSILEKHRGIARNIGDLNFAYFDENSEKSRIQKALHAAIEIIDLEIENPVSNRYVLLSFGTALTGNVTGSEELYEITAMGSPVNLLQRMDELTKKDAFKKIVPPNSIVMSEEFINIAREYFPHLQIKILDLMENGLKIRSFEKEVHRIGSISFTSDSDQDFLKQNMGIPA